MIKMAFDHILRSPSSGYALGVLLMLLVSQEPLTVANKVQVWNRAKTYGTLTLHFDEVAAAEFGNLRRQWTKSLPYEASLTFQAPRNEDFVRIKCYASGHGLPQALIFNSLFENRHCDPSCTMEIRDDGAYMLTKHVWERIHKFQPN
jgi:hypothetical protein